jgi:hypothetical protein
VDPVGLQTPLSKFKKKIRLSAEATGLQFIIPEIKMMKTITMNMYKRGKVIKKKRKIPS